MRDAIDKGLRPTSHTYFVVAPLDQLFMMWSAVNRVTRAGEVIRADRRVTSLEARGEVSGPANRSRAVGLEQLGERVGFVRLRQGYGGISPCR